VRVAPVEVQRLSRRTYYDSYVLQVSDQTSGGLEAVHKAEEQQPDGLKKPMQQ
jgi:hypothetical protein